jgi:hypothetical protein
MKTLKLIEQYKTLLEQDAEEMDAPIDATDVTEQPEEAPAPLTAEGERYLIDLLVKAFLHIPDESEGKIVKELQATLLDSNPKDVAESIESMLELSVNDTKKMLNLTTDIN